MARPAPPPTLSAAARRAWPGIVGGVARGLSSRALESELRAAGLAVRRQDLLDAMRQAGAERQVGETLRFVRKDRRPDPSRLPQAATRTLRTYSFVAEVTGLDRRTGQRTSRYVTLSSNTVPTAGELDEQAFELTRDPEFYEGFDPDRALIVSARRAGPLGSRL